MIRKRSSPETKSRFEQRKKRKTHHRGEKPKITKETLLKALADIEDEIRGPKYDNLRERLKDLRGQVKVVLQRHEDEIKRLYDEIRDLKELVETLNAKNDELSREKEELMNKLAVAQATWMWESHLARFVVDGSKEIYEFKRFNQMTHYLKSVKAKDNLWMKINNRIGRWTRKHWDMVNNVRKERNGIAHPDFVDLDFVEAKITKLYPAYREPMRNMLDILKTTASLMKFGRLAKYYDENEDLFPPLRLSNTDKNVLNVIISWDRKFEEIGSLQIVKHDDAKWYVEKYVNDSQMIRHYFRLVDFIKHENSKRLGKLAWELEKRYPVTRKTTVEEREVLKKLKNLVPKRARNVMVLPCTIATLHIPDFLPKGLWKHGIKIVKKYFNRH